MGDSKIDSSDLVCGEESSPSEVMMVAAHPGDLRAAADSGLKTAYVSRPLEGGPNHKSENVSEGDFDVVADDFIDLAEKLGV